MNRERIMKLILLLLLLVNVSSCTKEEPQIEDMITDEVSRQLEIHLTDIEDEISQLSTKVDKLSIKIKKIEK